MRFQWRSVFIRLRDLNDGRFCWVTRSQWRLDLFGYEISVAVGFAGLLSRNNGWIYSVMKSQWLSVFIWLRHLNDGRFCWVTRSQWRLDLFAYESSMTAGFTGLRDLNDGRFYLFLFGYEISMTVGFFIRLRDLNDGRFCWVTRSQWRLYLFGYEISVTVGFYLVTRSQWR